MSDVPGVLYRKAKLDLALMWRQIAAINEACRRAREEKAVQP